jgi:hypothetical protein
MSGHAGPALLLDRMDVPFSDLAVLVCFTQARATLRIASPHHRKYSMKRVLSLSLLAFAAPFAAAQSSTDPAPKNVEVYKSKGPEKAQMRVGPTGSKGVVVTPGRDAQGGPPPGLQTKMNFPPAERPLKRETTTVVKEKDSSSKSGETKTVR